MKKLISVLMLVVLCSMGLVSETKAVDVSINEYPTCTNWYMKIEGGVIYSCRMCAACSPTCIPVEECRSLGPVEYKN